MKKIFTVLFILSCLTYSKAQVTFDGTINSGEGWGSAWSTSSGGPANSTGFGSGHEINALYSFGDATYLYFGIGGNVQSGNRILMFIDSKTGGFNTANFNRTAAPQGIDEFNSGTTFDSGFSPDFCLVIGTASSNYYFDLYTLSSSAGSNNYLGDSGAGTSGSDESGVGANPTNSTDNRGFEVRISKSVLGYTNGNDIKVFL